MRLSADLVEMRPWPTRSALFVGVNPSPLVVAGLDHHRVQGFVATTQDPEAVASAGPFSFIIISADALSADSGIAWVDALHRHSRSAWLLLEYPASERRTSVLVRALRAGVHDVFDPTDPQRIHRALRIGLGYAHQHRERVLAIGAHPDDVELGCAGTMLDHRMRGDRITILTLSRGAIGGSRISRLREATETAEALGAQLLFGDLPDTEISAGIDTIRLIEDVVETVDPTVVYVHSLKDNHQDHRAVSTATASATRGVRRVFAYQSPSATNDFRPTRFVPVDKVLQRKIEILGMFDSQHGRTYLDPEMVAAGARYWARHLGAVATHAEPFEVIRTVGDLRSAETTPTVYADQLSDAAVSVAEPRLRIERIGPNAPVRKVTL